ncbi:translation initiation factor IF-2 isoform X3 [Nerophis ophidion]|uniref:translation initiation factor IF-2 isoform X3 n=1 Tax=Nerophis ophidion TaxID=159077 RepID=UPI002AE066FD|nr:translation initiation factor IF-2 isoform X3 [Nerophis ophidion]
MLTSSPGPPPTQQMCNEGHCVIALTCASSPQAAQAPPTSARSDITLLSPSPPAAVRSSLPPREPHVRDRSSCEARIFDGDEAIFDSLAVKDDEMIFGRHQGRHVRGRLAATRGSRLRPLPAHLNKSSPCSFSSTKSALLSHKSSSPLTSPLQTTSTRHGLQLVPAGFLRQPPAVFLLPLPDGHGPLPLPLPRLRLLLHRRPVGPLGLRRPRPQRPGCSPAQRAARQRREGGHAEPEQPPGQVPGQGAHAGALQRRLRVQDPAADVGARPQGPRPGLHDGSGSCGRARGEEEDLGQRPSDVGDGQRQAGGRRLQSQVGDGAGHVSVGGERLRGAEESQDGARADHRLAQRRSGQPEGGALLP